MQLIALVHENDMMGIQNTQQGNSRGDRTAGQKATHFLNKRFTETSICSKVEQDCETGNG